MHVLLTANDLKSVCSIGKFSIDEKKIAPGLKKKQDKNLKTHDVCYNYSKSF
jgi:hypothetical protein